MQRIAFLALAALVAGLISVSPDALAQGSGTLRLGVSQCPDDYTGENYAVDCAVPAAGIEFFISTPNTDNVASGVSSDFEPVTFSLSQFDLNPDGPDTVWLGEWATENGGYAASCTVNQEPIPVSYEQIDFNDGVLFGIAFDFDGSDDILCNWYRIDGLVADEPVTPAGGVTELPATGAGSLALPAWWP